MRLWLTRQSNGLYMITKYKPILSDVDGGGQDVYIRKGEPIGIRNLCNKVLFLVKSKSVKKLQSIRIELDGWVITE